MKNNKKVQFLLCLIVTIFYYSANGQMVQVSRWVSPVTHDFTSIPSTKGTDAQILSWGYTNKIYQYDAYLTRPGGSNVTTVNRWIMPNCREFIMIAEHEITDQQLISWGYTGKEFLFYAFKSRPIGNFIAVNRWVNVKPIGDNCRDFTLSVTEIELSDGQLISWGYANKKTQFYVPRSFTYNGVILTTLQNSFLTTTQVRVCISGAVPNSSVTIEAINIPLTEDQKIQTEVDNSGHGCITFEYPIRDHCLLTTHLRSANGEIIARNESAQIIASEDFRISNLFSRLNRGTPNCPSTLNVKIKTGQDDLRGGSSKAFIKFHFSNGIDTREFPLSAGDGWAGGSSQTRNFNIGTNNPEELVGLTIRHDGTPNNDPFNGGNLTDTYDNWNIDSIQVAFNNGLVLMNLIGSPLVRFTGALRIKRFER